MFFSKLFSRRSAVSLFGFLFFLIVSCEKQNSVNSFPISQDRKEIAFYGNTWIAYDETFFSIYTPASEKNSNLQKSLNLKQNLSGRTTTSAGCKSCHETIYKNWYSSRHRVAFTNELYQEAHKREPSAWCLNCHSPFLKPGGDSSKIEDRVLSEEGVSCITCHVRNGKIITSEISNVEKNSPKNLHQYEFRKDMSESEYCSKCHDFPYPIDETVSKSEVLFSKNWMQSTYQEWKQSSHSKTETCQDCHLEAGSRSSHSFWGGHSPDKLKESFSLSIQKLEGTMYDFEIRSEFIGHSFPTGDVFRTIEVEVFDGKNFVTSHKWKKTIGNLQPEFREKNSPSKYLVEDNRISYPTDSLLPKRNFQFSYADRKNFQVHLKILYTQNGNELFHSESENSKLFSKTTVVVQSF